MAQMPTAAGDKQAKADVRYSPGHQTGDHCGICQHFEAPDRCEVVSESGPPTPGRIDPGYWCTQFKGRPLLSGGTTGQPLSNPILAAAYQKIESQLTPQNRQTVDKIEIAGMHAALQNGPSGILASLHKSPDPVRDAAKGAVSLVLILRHDTEKAGRGTMPVNSMASGAALLMMRALDFVSRMGMAKIDNAALERATHIFANTMFAAFHITPRMLQTATANVHAITQNPQAVHALNVQAGVVPHPNARRVPPEAT